MDTPRDATEILTDLREGRKQAAEELLPLVYEELRELAGAYLHREPRPAQAHTLPPTALVHEAYMKLVDQARVSWQGQAHFKAVAAQAMQRVLIDHARARNREKRGGQWRRVALHDAFKLSRDRTLDALMLHDALQKMRELDDRQARVVEYRLLGGLTSEETAELLGCSQRTVERDWKMGLAWLRRELSRH